MKRDRWRILLLWWLAGALRVLASWADDGAGRSPLLHFGAADFDSPHYNWTVCADPRGKLYVGNDALQVFDGRRWTRVAVGQETEVRSLALDPNGRLWVAGENDLGYFDERPDGQREFHSLRPALAEPETPPRLLSVHTLAGLVIFAGRDRLLLWDGRRFQERPLPNLAQLAPFRVGRELWVSQPGVALWRFDGQTWWKAEGHGLEQWEYRWAVLQPSGDVLLGSSQGLVRFVDGTLTRWPTEADAFLEKSRAVGAVALSNGEVVVATLFGGLLFLDEQARPLRWLNRAHGLPSQGITGLSLQLDGHLWVCGPHDVFRLDGLRRVTVFKGEDGFRFGPVRHLARLAPDTLMLATEEAWVRLAPARSWQDMARALPVQDFPTPYHFGVEKSEHAVLLGDARRWAEATADTVTPLPRPGRADVAAFVPSPRHPHAYLALAGRELVEWTLDSEGDASSRTLHTFPEAPTHLLLDDQERLWVATPRNGITVVTGAWEEVPVLRHFAPGLELPASFHQPRFFAIDDGVYAYHDEGIVRLDRTVPQVMMIPRRPRFLQVVGGKTGDAWALAQWPDEPVRLVRLLPDTQGFTVNSHRAGLLPTVGRPTHLFREPTRDLLWVDGTQGLMRLERPAEWTDALPEAPRLVGAWLQRGDQTIPLPLNQSPHFDEAAQTTLRLDYRLPQSLIEERPLLEFRLNDGDWVRSTTPLTLQNLRGGRHELDVRAAAGPYPAGPVSRHVLAVQGPWYQSNWSRLGGLLLVAASLVGLVQWRLHRIRKANTTLQQLVEQRTAELGRATAAKAAFLSTMGHELLNPLNGVIGLADELRAAPLPPRERHLATRLEACAAQLLSVIEDALEYARIEAGRVAVRPRPFRLAEPARAALQLFLDSPLHRSASLHWQVEETVGDSLRLGDPDRIQHILVNYLSNALKYGEGSPVTLSVTLADDPWVCFSVSDQGPGIPAAEQASLFHRFQRTTLARESGIPGTGLGLAACKAYAEALGGEVGVQSEPGHGSRFFLKVPLTAGAATTAAPPTPTHTRLDGWRVLVLDDHDFNREVLSGLLSRLGATVDTAGSVTEARSRFLRQTPDLVLVDFDLGEETGTDFARWVRRESGVVRRVPLLVTTAFAREEIESVCREAEVDGLLSKPLTPARLLAAIGRTAGAPALQAAREPATGAPSMIALLAGPDLASQARLREQTRQEFRRETAQLWWALRNREKTAAQRLAHRLISVAVLLDDAPLLLATRQVQTDLRHGTTVDGTLASLRAALHLVGTHADRAGAAGVNRGQPPNPAVPPTD